MHEMIQRQVIHATPGKPSTSTIRQSMMDLVNVKVWFCLGLDNASPILFQEYLCVPYGCPLCLNVVFVVCFDRLFGDGRVDDGEVVCLGSLGRQLIGYLVARNPLMTRDPDNCDASV